MKRTPVTYLCGPISLKDIESSKIWREKVTRKLESFGVSASNPFVNSGNNLPTIRKELCEAASNNDIDAIRYLVNNYFIKQDLEMVKRCNFITAWIPEDNGYEICGSYGEITLGHFLGKPVYIVTDRNFIEIPSWAIGCSTEIFKSWNGYYNMIKRDWSI